MAFDYEGLTVSVVRNEEQGLYQFGVVLDGAFVVIGGRKLGGVDDDIARAADVKAQQAEQAPPPASPLTPPQPEPTPGG